MGYLMNSKETDPLKALNQLLGRDLKPSPTSKKDIEEKSDDLLEWDSSRRKINTYIDEYVVTEEFMTKVRRYARQEIDSAVLSSLKTIAGIAIGTAIAILVTFLMTGKFK